MTTMTLRTAVAAVLALLVAAAPTAARKTRDFPDLTHAEVAAFVKEHDKILGDAQGFVFEITGYAVQVCQAEQSEGDSASRFKVTDALGARVVKESQTLSRYLDDLRQFQTVAKVGYDGRPGRGKGGRTPAKRKATAKDLDDAAEALDAAIKEHVQEFKTWSVVPKVITGHKCGQFKSVIAEAKKKSGKAWDDVENGLYLMLRATARAEGKPLPDADAVRSGTPYQKPF